MPRQLGGVACRPDIALAIVAIVFFGTAGFIRLFLSYNSRFILVQHIARFPVQIADWEDPA
jgi:hypothetical protein